MAELKCHVDFLSLRIFFLADLKQKEEVLENSRREIMKESLKFGPEWLRNTVAPAIETNSSQMIAAPATRYPLAEFRYGREEMLALFDKTARLPDVYAKYKKLFVEKIQLPLALTPSTDDDVEYPRNSWSTRPPLGAGGPPSGGRGRGSSADRGRGRGRGFYSSTGYQRSTSLYDEDGRSVGRVI